MDISRLKGFREFLPDEMEARRRVFEVMRQTALSFGFGEVDMPSLERLDLFRVKSGEEIVEQTFSFVDKGGREVTLIPELTPALARIVAHRKDLQKPVRWFSIPKIWRYEEPQSGRLREFYQFNADIFGSSSIYADAEVIALAMEILHRLGLAGKFQMRISDRYMMEAILREFGDVDVDRAFRAIDKIGRADEGWIQNELISAGIPDPDEFMGFISSHGGQEVLDDIEAAYPSTRPRCERLRDLMSLLDAYGYREHVVDLSIVRGLAYYTGVVFEAHDAKGEFRAILGGGRYDTVVKLFGGEDTPAVGFGMGDAVLELLMRREGVWPEERFSPDVFVASAGAREYAIEVAMKLRREGFRVEMDLSGKGLSKQLRYASRRGIPFVVIVGDREMEKGVAVLRDMAAGTQEEVPLKDLPALLRGRLP